MSQALYRKWRPARFDEVVGQEHVTRTLKNSVAAERIGHAYLLCGPRGTGKTTTARLIAKAVNCLHADVAQRPCNTCSICLAINEGRFLDLIEIDAASNTGVDDIRDLRDKINFSPSEGRFKVYIIDEVHMLSAAAFNALLKTLEEPPPHAMFVLATTEEHKVPLTIKSRCQQFNFRLLTEREITGRLEWLAAQESLQIEPEAVALIASQAAGSLRDAESLLDQLVAAPGDTIALERARKVLGTATDSAVMALTAAWIDGDAAAGLKILHEALTSGADPRQFSRQLVTHLRTLLLLQAGGSDILLDGPEERHQVMFAQAERAPRPSLIEAIKRFSEAAITPANSWQPQLPLELAFLEALPPPKPAAGPAHEVKKSQVISVREKAEPAAETRDASPAAAVDRPPAEEEPPASPDEADALDSHELEEIAAPSDHAVTLTAVKSHWREMLSQIGEQHKNLPPLLNMSKPLAIEGDTLILGVDYPIFKDKFDNTAGAAELVAETLSTLMGQKCNVRCVVTSEYPIFVSKEEFDAVAQELGGVVREE